MDTDDRPACLTRRGFLITGAGGVGASLALPEWVAGQPATLELAAYPVKKIARLSQLIEGEPRAFSYPLEPQPNFIVKLGAAAQGGVGPHRDVVAFSSLCTHMGGNLRGRYRHDLKAIGPCPLHFSTFDLRKGGIPVHASATQSLPQVVLAIDADDVYAVGVMGLIYGYRHNLKDGAVARGAVPRPPARPLTG